MLKSEYIGYELAENRHSQLHRTATHPSLPEALSRCQSEDGAKTVCLARFGSYEVRVIELSRDASAGSFPVWLELYEHNTRSTLDSCGCSELEEAVAAADELITHARQLCRSTR